MRILKAKSKQKKLTIEKCSKCGKNTFYNEEQTSECGSKIIRCKHDELLSKKKVAFMKKQYGKYWDKLPIVICLECWLDGFIKKRGG